MTSEALTDQYFNRDDIFFRIADQYGPLFRNVIFNNYLKSSNPADQFMRQIAEETSEDALSARLQSRHYFPSGNAAFKNYAIWVKRWFLPVKEIKEFINGLFGVLDWCIEQEGNYNEVLVDFEIGSTIITSAAELCFRFGDGGDEKIHQVLEQFSTQCKTTHIQHVIRNMWAKDLYPSWKTPTELYMPTHGQFLQSVFSPEGGLVSNIYRTICATERMIKHHGSLEDPDQGRKTLKHRRSMFSDMKTGLRGPFSESLSNTLQITECLLTPANVTRYYDIKEGDAALQHFVDLLFHETTPETRPIKLRFKYTLFLAGYDDYFALNMSLLDKDFLTGGFGHDVHFPIYWKTYRGSIRNKVPLETWKELLKITTLATFARQSERGVERAMTTLPTAAKREPPQFTTSAPVIPITRSKKRRRSPDTEEEGKEAEPVVKRTRGFTQELEEPGPTAEFEEPTATQNKNSYMVVLGGIGALTLGAVLYSKGRA